MAKRTPSGQYKGSALRPIVRETYRSDAPAAYGLAVHEANTRAQDAGFIQDVGPQISNPDFSGVQVKGQLGGGTFKPLTKSDKFK